MARTAIEKGLAVPKNLTNDWRYVDAAQAPAHGAWAEKRRVAALMRKVAESLVTSDVPASDLRSAGDWLEDFAARLSSRPRRFKIEAYTENAAVHDMDAFLDCSPLIGQSNPIAPPMRLWTEGDRVHGSACFGAPYEGPPGCLHGGFVAASFDELLGYAQSLTDDPGMTVMLSVRYLAPTPLETELRYDAWIERTEGRKIFAKGRLHANGTLTAEAEAIFVSIDRERFAELLTQARHRGGTSA